MSRLRAKCPDCRTLTAVALGPDYECHVCGREFHAGLVRVPRAWGQGGEAMAEAAFLPLPYPETAVIAEESLGEQTLDLASGLPERPLVLGGCCCAHVGAVVALASRFGRISLVWLDAHGDLNTAESSPSGNAWGMPFRMLLDRGAVAVEDALLLGARKLDPPEQEYIATRGLRTDASELAAALEGTEGVYVALDADLLEPGHVGCFMPEPGGPALEEAEHLLGRIASQAPVLGFGLTGLVPSPESLPALVRLCKALGL